jgi:endonuclease/exonuclease/phosphatase family metal-dependent hydrolase
VLFTSYNTFDLFESRRSHGREHYRQVVTVIRGLRPDILAVQEIRGAWPQQAAESLRLLARDTGMSCDVSAADDGGPQAALATGSRGYHCGLLWQPELSVLPGSFRESGPGALWHCAGWVTFRFGATLVRHASFHATPFGRELRAQQNALLLTMLLTGPEGRLPLLVGADWNGECADLVPAGASGGPGRYEPGDPFAGLPWRDDMIHQCTVEHDADSGEQRHRVDRTAGQVLVDGGLTDAAAALRALWQATCGHYPGDGYGSQGIMRRIDAIRVTRQVVPALRSHQVTDTPLARRASDHLPVSVSYDPAAIRD